jgi:hypothetical protein
MAKAFGATIVDKRKAPEMMLLSFFLQQMGVMDAEKFCKKFAITIGSRIYLPYKPGVFTKDWPEINQLINIGHECQHAHQFDEDPRFTVRYLSSRSHRCRYECEAKHTDLELYYALTGRLLSVPKVVRSLRHYMLRKSDLSVATTDLTIYNRFVGRDMVGTQAGRTALNIINDLS